MVRTLQAYPTKKVPRVSVHARNRKTGAHASRTYYNTTPDEILKALDRALATPEAQPSVPNPV